MMSLKSILMKTVNSGWTFILVTIAEEELVRVRVAFSIFNVGLNGSCWLVRDLAPPSAGGVN